MIHNSIENIARNLREAATGLNELERDLAILNARIENLENNLEKDNAFFDGLEQLLNNRKNGY